jgi:hypothetical protein
MKRLFDRLRAKMCAPDKLLHILAGMAVASWSATGWPTLWWLPITAAVIAGAAKELYDRTGRGTVDRWDFIATTLGGAVVWGALLIKTLFS